MKRSLHSSAWRRILPLACAFLIAASLAATSPFTSQQLDQQQTGSILDYIAKSWDALTRSITDCSTFSDSKTSGPQTLYLAQGVIVPASIADLQNSCDLKIQLLRVTIPPLGQTAVEPPGLFDLQPPGLLYLPNPYVVPGGRFNEMYGWDSYFIIRGLLRAGKRELARGIVRNFFFEIDHYGGVLNANRTYYFSRSQPPFLTSMILAVYDAEKAADLAQSSPSQTARSAADWLREAYPFAVREHALWMSSGHSAGNSGLARYFDFGDGPVPEMADSPDYYRGAADYLARHRNEAGGLLVTPQSPDAAGPAFNVSPCSPPPGSQPAPGAPVVHCNLVERVSLTREFYKGDRSMRESGFDTSFRFGPYGGFTHHFAAVDLNSLLYKSELDLADIASLIGHDDESQQWHKAADVRRRAINKYLWNSSAGMYFDYDFTKSHQSSYIFASTFYPLWAGLASAQQAGAIASHLKDFERAGGLMTSTQETGAQWDAPYGWAPIQLIGVEGLRRYGFNVDADRISREFLGTVIVNFKRDSTIREKYDVVHRTAETHVDAGYSQNVIGFGWTNAVYLEFLDQLKHKDAPTQSH
jgi:alpha,alpha-trehalase